MATVSSAAKVDADLSRPVLEIEISQDIEAPLPCRLGSHQVTDVSPKEIAFLSSSAPARGEEGGGNARERSSGNVIASAGADLLSLEGRATSLIDSANLNAEAGMLDGEPCSIDGISFAFAEVAAHLSCSKDNIGRLAAVTDPLTFGLLPSPDPPIST